ncbi:expressed unknown protein [Seminavis robusta]|uniref:Uncharacterized protein n=1 Tax=Seminavis robusta TaxID=568900 RepID=A0A9N8HV19_9STRA|nr:expressed unknown protein [Seminavis robusta]|eukprot:Sro1916_g305210.1 n/a (337) ;mRNA; f:8431-9441
MTGGNKLQRRISKLLLNPLKSGRRGIVRSRSQRSHVEEQVTIVCTPNYSMEDILSQLTQVNKKVHSIVLQEMIQRPDNVPLFCKIQDLLRSSSYKGVQSIHLLEPHIHFTDYRRWCYKRTNFLHRIRKDAKERDIDVVIHGTLLLDYHHNNNNNNNTHTTDNPQQLSQNISSWLTLLQQLPQDPDITSLWISLREEAVVHTSPSAVCGRGPRRPSQLELMQSPVQKVFQALIELFNSDTRSWRFVHCHVQYHHDADKRNVNEEQTQALLDVAELFHIPLQVQWQPLSNEQPAWTRTTTMAEQRFPACAAKTAEQQHQDDHTSTTYGSSGAFGAVGN